MPDEVKSPVAQLAAVLARITRERGVDIEFLRAEQILTEASQARPGKPEQMWSQWLADGVKSLELRPKISQLTVAEALHLSEDGALLIGRSATESIAMVVLGFDGEVVEIASSENSEVSTKVTPEEFAALLEPQSGYSADSQSSKHFSWLIIEDLELSHEAAHQFHHRPIARFIALLRPEWSDIWVVGVFAFFAGMLSLATPIAVESLVNMVAFGRTLQPLLILSLLLFAFLAFAAMMRALQTFVVEIIQRRLFTRVAADFAYRFPRVDQTSLDGRYGPELANRFFDIVTLQKVVAQLLLDGIAIVLATFVGMAVLAFYHPWLLGFDVLLLVLVVGGVILLGRGAIAAGIDESKQKYRLAAWLEDLLRCPVSFKAAGAAEFALDRANQVTAAYLTSRRQHFSVLFRQLLFIMGLQVAAGTVLLGFGGWLVVQGQLTLGQLVAAELIVATILGSLAKLGKHIDGFYDVIASVDKLGYLFDLDMEPQDGLLAFRPTKGVRLRVTDVKHSKGEGWLATSGVELNMDSGEQAALLGPARAGASVLLDILYGLRTPEAGHVEIEHADPRDLRPDVLRRVVTLVRDVEIFEGTIAENIQLGRAGISTTDIRAALYAVGLLDDVLRLPDGLDTKINPSGYPLLATQRSLLALARGIAGRPKLLLIDGTLDTLGDAHLNQVCESLRDASNDWTLLVATNRGEVAEHFDRIIDIDPLDDLDETKQLPTLPGPGGIS